MINNLVFDEYNISISTLIKKYYVASFFIIIPFIFTAVDFEVNNRSKSVK